MATKLVHVDGLVAALDMPWSMVTFFEDHEAELTTEHPTSSRGLPVLVKDDTAYGPGDLAGITLHMSATSEADAELIQPAIAAGWKVKVSAWCHYCGEALSNPETRRPGDEHPACMRDRLRDS